MLYTGCSPCGLSEPERQVLLQYRRNTARSENCTQNAHAAFSGHRLSIPAVLRTCPGTYYNPFRREHPYHAAPKHKENFSVRIQWHAAGFLGTVQTCTADF
jgi:hypothetical protein